jgi:hypothetical protein
MPVVITGNNTPTAGGITYGDGSTYANTVAGTSGQLLQSNGASAPTWATVSAGFTLGTPVATTSGTFIDFLSIPAGVKQIVISFSGVSTDAISGNLILVQIGDSGGVETTGYLSTGARVTNGSATQTNSSTSGFAIYVSVTGDIVFGHMTLMLENSTNNSWVSSHSARGALSSGLVGGGNKSLSATLDRVRITTLDGTDLFDAGEINIAYI